MYKETKGWLVKIVWMPDKKMHHCRIQVPGVTTIKV